MKHLFIVNPVAGGKDSTQAISEKAAAAFADREDSYEVYVTKAPRDATEKIKAEAKSGEHIRVYACGGDGTFNECASGAVGLENVAVCPFPTGTGNDFCRMFGEEKDCFRNLDALLNGWEHPIDVVDCNGNYGVNICSVGIDARVGLDVHKYSHLPLVGGACGYVVSLVVNVLKGINRMMKISAPGYENHGPHALVCACNGRYYGGGFHPSLDARPDDGELDVYIIRKVSLIALASFLGKYSSGRSDELPAKYISHIHTDTLSIEFDDEDLVNVDGEGFSTKKVEMKVLPGAVKLIVPETMHFFDDRKKL